MATDQEYLESEGLTNESTTNTQTQNDTSQAASDSGTKPVETFEIIRDGKTYTFPVTTEFSYNHNNKISKVPYSTLVNSHRLGEHLNEKMKTYNDQAEEFKSRSEDFDKYKTFHEKFGALQDWSEKNPEDWSRLEDVWKNKEDHLLRQSVNQNQTGETPPTGQIPDALLQEMSSMRQKMNSQQETIDGWTKHQEDTQKQSDVDYVNKEIEEFQKAYPEIDLNEKDPEGVPLRARIMQNGVQENMPTFKSAALSYLEDRLADTFSRRARNETSQSIKSDAQNGIIAKSTTPFIPVQGQSANQQINNIRNKTWDELGEDALSHYEELTSSQSS